MEKLTPDEFKSFCQWFHSAGLDRIPFEIIWPEFVKSAKEASAVEKV